MPIRPKVRPLYGPEWRNTTTLRIIRREGYRCRDCRVPNYLTIARNDNYPGWWFTLDGEAHDQKGELRWHIPLVGGELPLLSYDRLVTIVLSVAHLDRIPGHDDDSNLAAFCQWCHLNYDRRVNVAASRETRLDRKDKSRPILWEAS